MVSVTALATYYQSAKPLLPVVASTSVQQQCDDVLDLADVIGKRVISTRLHSAVPVAAENAAAALEAMTRFAVNPKWLVYLPPTMSPCETSSLPDFLEHPTQAFAYFRKHGVGKVLCEEKHMGSRAVIVLCRSEAVALSRFGIANEGIGCCYTRTGKRFFGDPAMETACLAELRDTCDRAGLWEKLASDWVCLDAEVMPWSMKAQELLRTQYAAVGSAAKAALGEARTVLAMAAKNRVEVAPWLTEIAERQTSVGKFTEAYARYCWDVLSIADVRVAPFHVLASEGAVHADKPHPWHMEVSHQLAAASTGLVRKTSFEMVDLSDAESEARATAWWLSLVAQGGEGMVVKPLDFITRGPKGLVQPAVKVRGPEYLRIIYGPEYSLPGNLPRLRSRHLSRKRGLALSEFALGLESLERFVRREPLRRVHECVFGVLALESEPVDPRL
jgi:protein phosphatase